MLQTNYRYVAPRDTLLNLYSDNTSDLEGKNIVNWVKYKHVNCGSLTAIIESISNPNQCYTIVCSRPEDADRE